MDIVVGIVHILIGCGLLVAYRQHARNMLRTAQYNHGYEPRPHDRVLSRVTSILVALFFIGMGVWYLIR
ncbi:hypothetical protein ACQEU3_24245 [Spirillospora sp. CA-253888]